MSQPDFQAMSQKELHAYVLAHRDDQAAFYAFVDKLHAEANWIDMPPLESEADLDNYPEFLEHLRQSAASRDNAA